MELLKSSFFHPITVNTKLKFFFWNLLTLKLLNTDLRPANPGYKSISSELSFRWYFLTNFQCLLKVLFLPVIFPCFEDENYMVLSSFISTSPKNCEKNTG